MRRWPPRVLGALALSAVLAACGGQQAVSTGGYTIFVHGRSLSPRGGMGALIEGRLATRDGCVILELEDGDLWFPVVWPAGTSIASTDPLVIRLPSGEPLSEGQKVTGGGGYLKPERLDVEIPPGCLPETNEVAVFNPDERVTRG